MTTKKVPTSVVTPVDVQITKREPIRVSDRFASPDYDDPDARKPRIQALRGEDPSQFGLFISHSAMAECGWSSLELKELIKYKFQSGSEEEGLLFKRPRMLVNQTSPLFAYDRLLSQEKKRMIAELFDASIHSDREKYGVGCVYDVMLLDDDNAILHEKPLQMMLKGSTSASFAEEWQAFLTEITTIYCKNFGTPVRAKNAVFNSLCVFQPVMERRIVGQKVKSPALYFAGHVTPTDENWTDSFIGCKPDEVIDSFISQFSYNLKGLPSSIAALAPATLG